MGSIARFDAAARPASQRPHRRAWRLLMAVGAITAIAGATASLGGAASARTANSALHRSAKATTIKVGIPVADPASLAALGQPTAGLPTVAQTELMFTSQIKAINASGELGARKLVPVFNVYSLASPAAPEASCVSLTEDSHVLAVVSGQFVNGGDVCVAQHGTPMIESVAAPQSAYSSYPGLVYSAQMAPNRNARDFAHELVASGALKGQTVGVLADSLGGDYPPVSQVLVPALEAAGIKVAHVTDLTADFSELPQQIPVEISAMRSAGVTMIVDATPGPNLLMWLGGMQSAGWSAKFATSDLNNADFAIYTSRYPASMNGTVAYTSERFGEGAAGFGAQPGDRQCLQRYVSAGGARYARDSSNYVTLEQSCQALTMFIDGVRATKGAASVKSFARAMAHLGKVALPFQGPSSLSAGKTDAADAVRVTHFSSKAATFVPSSPKWTTVSAAG